MADDTEALAAITGLPPAEASRLLEAAGGNVEAAADAIATAATTATNRSHHGEETAATSQECDFGIVFIDEIYGTHEMRGIDATRQIRSKGIRSRAGVPLPIVGCTGNENHRDHNANALAAGQNLVWGKPQPPVAQMRKQLDELLCVDNHQE